MPIRVEVWRMDGALRSVPVSRLEEEDRLEDALAADLGILGVDLLLIGRQVVTDQGNKIDLLAMKPNGDLVVVELKRHRTPRDVVAQSLDYGSWVSQLTQEEIREVYAKHAGGELEAGFSDAFDESLPEDLNQNHELIVVCSELDASTERIIGYLAKVGHVAINVVFFRYFRDEGREYLTRTWLVPPDEAEATIARGATGRTSEPWNGTDYYVTLGEDDQRSWEDCRRYGFVSAGGGRRYRQALAHLTPGARVFVNIPRRGYVGIGEVTDPLLPAQEFHVEVNGSRVPILKAPHVAKFMEKDADDPELAEYMVRVRWLAQVPREQAFSAKGLFGKQHVVCKLKNRFTIEKVTEHFKVAG